MPASLTQYRQFVSTPPNRRSSVVAQTKAPRRYDPRTDYYKQIREAVVADRRTSRDGAAVSAAAANATDKKRARYAVYAGFWSQMTDRWNDCTAVHLERTDITVGGLTITMPAYIFGEMHPDGSCEVVLVHFADYGLNADVVDMLLRLLQRTYEVGRPRIDATIIDLPNRTVHSNRGRDLSHHDDWIAMDAAAFAYALRAGQAEAA